MVPETYRAGAAQMLTILPAGYAAKKADLNSGFGAANRHQRFWLVKAFKVT